MDQQTVQQIKDVLIIALVVYVVLRDILHTRDLHSLTQTAIGFAGSPLVIQAGKDLAESVPQPVFIAMLSALTGAKALLPAGDAKDLVKTAEKVVEQIDHDPANDPVSDTQPPAELNLKGG